VEKVYGWLRKMTTDGALTLPLSYAQFRVVMALAFARMGGRDQLEGSSEIRGVEIVDGE
jgi:hypothetical protein